jgi:hypothetical protein
VLVLAALIAQAGCGGGPAAGAGEGTTAASVAPPPPPRWQDDLSLLLPADAAVVARADTARLRASPYYPTLREAFVRREREGEVLAAVFEAADELWVGARFSSDDTDPDVVIVARGASLGPRADAAAVQRGFASRERIGHFDVLRESPGAGSALVALAPDTRVFARSEAPEVVVARAEARAARGGLSDPRIGALAARLGLRSASAAVAAVLPDAERARLRRRRGPQALLADARAFGARLEASDGLILEATADMESPEAATRARDAVTVELDRLAGNPLLAILGLRDVFARARLTTSGDHLDLSVALPDAEARSLLQRFGPLLGTFTGRPASRVARGGLVALAAGAKGSAHDVAGARP